jgi:uncharacterized membrane protein YqjE
VTVQGVARSAGGALLTQATLHAELLGEAWLEEKARLRGMAMASLMVVACFLCTLLATGVLLLALWWDTPLRIPVVVGLLVAYGLGTVIAWRNLRRHANIRNEALAASRNELAADLRLFRDQS